MNMTGQRTFLEAQQSGAIDVRVADHFCRNCTIFNGVPDGAKFLAANLFGLVCLDSENGELLLPVTSAMPHPHRARIYTSASVFKGKSDGFVTTPELLTTYYWNINGYVVDWVLLDSSGNDITDTPGAPVKRTGVGPWNDFKFVRNIVTVGGKPLLSNRTDPLRVTGRVMLKGDYVEAGAPYTTLGQFSEWKVTPVNGTDAIIGATTDNMTFVRRLPPETTRVRIVFTPIGSSLPKDSVELSLTGNHLALAVTHATDQPPADAKKLEDTMAFGLLLEGGDMDTFPTAVFHRGVHGESAPVTAGFISSSDGHCEGGGG